MKEKKKIGRREFLKVAGAGAAVTTAALYGCKPRTAGSASEADGAQQGQMTYRTNPKTGDRVSLLGYGCMRFPLRPDGTVDEAQAARLIHRAVQGGAQSGGKVGPVDAGQPRHRRRGLARLQGLHQGGKLGHLLENVE